MRCGIGAPGGERNTRENGVRPPARAGFADPPLAGVTAISRLEMVVVSSTTSRKTSPTRPAKVVISSDSSMGNPAAELHAHPLGLGPTPSGGVGEQQGRVLPRTVGVQPHATFEGAHRAVGLPAERLREPQAPDAERERGVNRQYTARGSLAFGKSSRANERDRERARGRLSQWIELCSLPQLDERLVRVPCRMQNKPEDVIQR